MMHLGFVLAAAMAVTAPTAGSAPAAAPLWDVLVVNGQVLDGSGALPIRTDIAVRGGRIAFMGDGRGMKAKKVIDAAGLVVAPGFIDVHSHAEFAALKREHRQNLAGVTQGITTAIFGADGAYSPRQIAERKAVFARNGIGTNFGFYVGHGGIRSEIMGADFKRRAKPDEVRRMRSLVRTGMAEGAVGLSTGLMYDPGSFSDTDEVVALAQEVAPFGGIYDSHVRDPADRLLESDREALEIGRRAGIPSKIAHEKAVGTINKGRTSEVVALINAERSAGRDAVIDQYPYDAAGVEDLTTIFVIAGPNERIEHLRAALADPAARDIARRLTEEGKDGGFSWVKALGWEFRIVDSPEAPQLVGRTIEEMARERGIPSFDAAAELVRKYGRIRITLGSIEEAGVRLLMVQPWTMIATDGFATDAAGDPSGRLCRQHPRSTGTYPRVLGRYVREQGVLSLPDAVRKMTSLPARFLGLADRGLIQVGKAADLTLFDPKNVADLSTYAKPCALSRGIEHVLVNGVAVMEKGKPTGATPGRFVPRQTASPATADARRRGERNDPGR